MIVSCHTMGTVIQPVAPYIGTRLDRTYGAAELYFYLRISINHMILSVSSFTESLRIIFQVYKSSRDHHDRSSALSYLHRYRCFHR